MGSNFYKAKRLDNGEWIEGTLYPNGRWLNVFDKDNIYIGNDIILRAVDPKTVCRDTGLRDKNMCRIYEKDLVDCHEKRGAAFFNCVVLWNEVKARFDVNAMDCNFPMMLDGCSDDIAINGLDYEIVGNIFDNPELLVS